MNHYIDINLFPDAEIPGPVLMNSVFSKLHKALCDLSTTTIGVSFPKARVTLCNLLRIHGTESDLSNLMSKNWLGRISGYCSISQVTQVPDSVKYRTVSRKHFTKSAAKLRRQRKRGNLTESQLADYQDKMTSQYEKTVLPYLDLTSGSNGHRHRRFIELGPLLDSPEPGQFDQFGLSKTATIPWF